MGLKEDIDSLNKKSEKEVNRLSKLLEEYPNIQKYTGRWNKVAYYDKSVNDKVTDYDMRHNCGCCSDSPLEIWPYLETPNGKLYSDPPIFNIGERYYDGGDMPNPNWEEKLIKANIPQAIIDRIAFHFKHDEEQRALENEQDDE